MDQLDLSRPFYEYERTWRVDPDILRKRVDLQQPWSIVQAYFDSPDLSVEVSMRLIPARGLAIRRTKTITYNGIRLKTSDEFPYVEGVKAALEAPRIATKERHLVVDDWGRAWLVDYFMDIDAWVAETEFDTREDMDSDFNIPVWAIHELTAKPEGYTRNRAYTRTPDNVTRVIDYAAKTGTTAMYLPGEAPDFRWSQAPGLKPRSK